MYKQSGSVVGVRHRRCGHPQGKVREGGLKLYGRGGGEIWEDEIAHEILLAGLVGITMGWGMY